ncbi:hypothetical protein L1249_13525 [Halomonas sp. Cn5-12]|nr:MULTISPECIES: hypothetical protein [Halomonas]MCF2913862.1 hypothetical protein [Halomonas sp. Cn5-12]
MLVTRLPYRHQQGVGEQRQSNVAMPTGPAPHLILIQTAFPFGRLKTLLDFPALTCDSNQRLY